MIDPIFLPGAVCPVQGYTETVTFFCLGYAEYEVCMNTGNPRQHNVHFCVCVLFVSVFKWHVAGLQRSEKVFLQALINYKVWVLNCVASEVVQLDADKHRSK